MLNTLFCNMFFSLRNLFWIFSHVIAFPPAHDSEWLIFLDFCLFVALCTNMAANPVERTFTRGPDFATALTLVQGTLGIVQYLSNRSPLSAVPLSVINTPARAIVWKLVSDHVVPLAKPFMGSFLHRAHFQVLAVLSKAFLNQRPLTHLPLFSSHSLYFSCSGFLTVPWMCSSRRAMDLLLRLSRTFFSPISAQLAPLPPSSFHLNIISSMRPSLTTLLNTF